MPARTLAIGDIHGCLIQFDALLAVVQPTREDHLILLGDYIDRGPDSAGVLNRILQLAKTHRLTLIKGNHEQMMLAARGRLEYQRDWVLNGGDATLISYAGNRATLKDVPAEHWNFLEKRLVDYFENDTHIFVHANAYPDAPMSEQPDYMLRWERCDEIAPHHSGKTIICGHTPQNSGRPMNRGYAICIDTNACSSGLLTCLDASTGKIWQADKNSQVTRAHISDFEAD
jgi:serine/threonine protein phosphatase 1